MNIALEKTTEFVNGQKRREYGDAFVRGNNGEYSFSSPHLGHQADETCSYVHFGRLMNA
jgi:U6 snRNA-associated Sm-like protein LSm6